MEKVVQSDSVAISVSVVSHGQMHLVVHLLQDLQTHCSGQNFELILTLNVDENLQLEKTHFSFPIQIIVNSAPKGFGANHNQAFRAARGNYFCVVNPDIRLNACPFTGLMACLAGADIGAIAPLVLDPSGRIEDSARRFPTPGKIMVKAFSGPQIPDYSFQAGSQHVDWVGGMFMLFPGSVFRDMNGFDERYFLYYEDVDICARLSLANFHIVLFSGTYVVHHAQRSSHRRLKYLVWHLCSMVRFFMSGPYQRLKRLGRL